MSFPVMNASVVSLDSKVRELLKFANCTFGVVMLLSLSCPLETEKHKGGNSKDKLNFADTAAIHIEH